MRQPGHHPDPASAIALRMAQEAERQREQQVATALRKRALYLDGFPGAVAASVTGISPAGWIRADGQGVTTDYPDLRADLIAAGSPHGTDGSGNPRVPNLNASRFLRGNATPGGTGGQDTTSGTTGVPSATISVDRNLDAATISMPTSGHTHLESVETNLPPYVNVVWFVKT